MINQNLKTRVQALIDAASGSTSLDDLLLIRKSAVGLGCNEANLDAQIAARLTALGAGATAIELVGGNVSLGLNNRIMYQTPIAVDSGDQLFIDALGVVKKEKHPLSAVVHASLPNFNGVQLDDMLCGFSGVFVPGELGACRELFDFALSDGNRMIGVNNRVSASNYGLQVYVTTPDRKAIVWANFIVVSPAGYEAGYMRTLGAFEVSANTFRIYFSAAPDGTGGATTNILFHSLAYNTGTKAVAGAAGTLLFTGSAGHSLTAQSATRQGERYVALASPVQIATLDMQSSTVTVHSSLPGGSSTAFDHADPANVFARAVSSSTVRIIKAGVAAPIDLPANLITDGCFGSTWRPTLIGSGMFITLNATTGQLKLVKFNAAYTTATIYSLGFAAIANNATRQLFVTDGTRYWIRFNNTSPMIYFKWDGLSAPTEFSSDCDETTLHRNPRFAGGASMNRVITAADKAVAFAAPYTSFVSEQAGHSGVIMTFDAAELLHYDVKLLGTAITSGAANSAVELELSHGLRYDHRAIGNKHNTRQHQGVRVAFGALPVMGSTDVPFSSLVDPVAQMPFGSIAKFDPAAILATIGTYTAGETGFIWIYSPDGLVRSGSGITIACHRPFVAVFFGNAAAIRKEVSL